LLLILSFPNLRFALVGAGSVVLHDIAVRAVAAGTPAKDMKTIDDLPNPVRTKSKPFLPAGTVPCTTSTKDIRMAIQ
jgi:hypothetical protein